MHTLDNVVTMFIPIVGIIASFALVGVTIWVSQRRREREIHYRHELHKKLVDKGADKDELIALMRADDKNRWANRREGLKLGGLVILMGGLGSMIGLRFIEDEAIWLTGAIPTLVGFGLLLYALVLAPRDAGD